MTPEDPGVERAREAVPSPGRTRPEPPGKDHQTPADAAGERSRDEHPPEEPGPVTPAPPRFVGPDVNDIDSLEEPVGPRLGGPEGTTLPRT